MNTLKLITTFLLILSTSSLSLAESEPLNLQLVFDASGSMWGQVEGKSKIEISREVLGEVIKNIDDQSSVGLIAYGHRRKADCSDIESLIPLEKVNKEQIQKTINKVNPKGKTPITAALKQAIDPLRSKEEKTTVLLISDGLETCSGDPCELVRQAKASGVDFQMHVIGFDVGEVNAQQLECVAQAGGGLYLSAKNADELKEALKKTTEVAEVPDSKLSVKTVKNGKLADVLLEISKKNSDEEIKGIRTYSSKETNPRILPIEPGVYQVEAKLIAARGIAKQVIKEIEVKKGETTEKVIDFSAGELAVKVTRNGKLSDAVVHVYPKGEKKVLTQSRTYRSAKSNPKVFELSPGEYDIVIGSVEVSGKPETRISGVSIKANQKTTKEHQFSSGTLRVGAINGESLVDAVIHVRQIETNKQSAQGRTYTSSNSNPKEFELSPGNYTVKLKPIKLKGAEPKEIKITIEAGGVIEQMVDFQA